MKVNNEKLKTSRWKTRRVERKNQPAIARSGKWVLHLYVVGETKKAVTAFNNLKLFCEDQLKDKYHIEVIDLLKNPQIAREDQILAIPTLVRKSPLPERNIIGNLSNTKRLMVALNLNE